MAKKVLVVGSVHLDILGDVTDGFENVDKIGTLSMSVGGSAFNVAANLAFHGHKVGLLSVVNPNSFGHVVIKLELEKRRIDGNFLLKSPYVPESGFVAHTRDKNLISAVSCMGIEQFHIPEQHLTRALQWADAVAIDANLSRETICQVARASREFKKPLFACCVSESKVARLFRALNDKQPYFIVVAMNEKEARKIGYDLLALGSAIDLQRQLCIDLSSEAVIITTSGHGYEVFSNTEKGTQHDRYKPVVTPNVVSTLGAGDALFASVVARPTGDWSRHHESVAEYLYPVLTSWSAVPEIERKRHVRFPGIFDEDTTTFLLLIAAAAVSIVGFFGALTSYTALGCLFFTMSALAGSGGALLARMLDAELVTQSRRDITFGIAAGLASAFLLAIPYLLSGADERARVPLLKTLLLTGFIVNTVAGMTSREYLKRLQRSVVLPDKLPAPRG